MRTIKNKFKEVRLYCRKPSIGRTIHSIITSQVAIHAYTTVNSNGNVLYLEKDYDYKILADDTSNIGQKYEVLIGFHNVKDYGLYNHGYYVPSEAHFQIYEEDRMECDDSTFDSQGSDQYAGTWQIFIR